MYTTLQARGLGQVWEEHTVHLQRREAASFGFAVSGGGEEDTVRTEVVVEDVVRGSPADGRLR